MVYFYAMIMAAPTEAQRSHTQSSPAAVQGPHIMPRAKKRLAINDGDRCVHDLESLPARVRNIATLRGLGYTFREIGEQLEVSPQAISLMLSRHRRVLRKIGGAVELKELSSRAVNALGQYGIRTRAEARAANVLELLSNQRNCGRKTLDEIARWMTRESANGSVPAKGRPSSNGVHPVGETAADGLVPNGSSFVPATAWAS